MPLYPPSPPSSSACLNASSGRADGYCDDGGPGAEFAICPLGTDCTDCGPRGAPPSPPLPPPPVRSPPPEGSTTDVACSSSLAADTSVDACQSWCSFSTAAGSTVASNCAYCACRACAVCMPMPPPPAAPPGSPNELVTLRYAVRASYVAAGDVAPLRPEG